MALFSTLSCITQRKVLVGFWYSSNNGQHFQALRNQALAMGERKMFWWSFSSYQRGIICPLWSCPVACCCPQPSDPSCLICVQNVPHPPGLAFLSCFRFLWWARFLPLSGTQNWLLPLAISLHTPSSFPLLPSPSWESSLNHLSCPTPVSEPCVHRFSSSCPLLNDGLTAF